MTPAPSPNYIITGIAGKKGFASVTIEKDMMNAEVGFWTQGTAGI